jgi:GxxExxY protein
MPNKLLHSDLTFKIRGAMFSVHNKLGFGHKEIIYQRALAKELDKLGVNYKREPKLKINYEGETLGVYTPDFLVDDRVIVELKSARMSPVNLDRQIVNYLKATGYDLALAVNFGQSKLEIKRRIWTRVSAKSVPKSV